MEARPSKNSPRPAFADDEIITLFDDIYAKGRNPHDNDPALGTRIGALTGQLCDRVAKVAGSVPRRDVPANGDSFHLVTWSLPRSKGISLTARVCAFAPLLELSWLIKKGTHRSAEALDPDVLKLHARAHPVARAALAAADELGLQVLPWNLLRSPAPPEWPRQFWMPEQPELRNYLFPGFFETWPEDRTILARAQPSDPK